MRHRLQGRQVLAAVILTAIMLAALILSSGVSLLGGKAGERETYPARPFGQHARAIALPLDTPLIMTNAVSLLALLAFTLASTYFLNGVFRRTGSGEAFFLLSFVLSLAPEAVRVAAAALTLAGANPELAVAATRVVYMGRLYGLTSLFCAALCGLGSRYGDYGVLTGVGLLLAAVMGALLPLDTSRLTTGLIHAVSDGGGLLSAAASGAALVALGALLTPLVRRERHLLGYGLGTVLLLAGRELYTLGALVPFGAGLVLLVGGTWLAARSLERTYLGIV